MRTKLRALSRFKACAIFLAVACGLLACSEPTPAGAPQDGVFAVVTPTEKRHETALRLAAYPGVWGVQEIPPREIVFNAPAPLPSAVRELLQGYQIVTQSSRLSGFAAAVLSARLAPPVAASVARAQAQPLVGDALVESRPQPPPPGRYSSHAYSRVLAQYRTSEVMAGSVAVAVLLPESNGVAETSTENWTADDVTAAVTQISLGLARPQAACKSCRLSFVVHVVGGNPQPGAAAGTVDTDYEHINHAFNDLTVNQDMLSRLGYPENDTTAGFRRLANDVRAQFGTDWAVVVKVGLDKAAGGGAWGGSGLTAVSYLGGPLMAVTFMNAPWGTSDLAYTVAHELNHSFYATDEYDIAGVSPASRAGYYQAANAGSAHNDGTGYVAGAGEADPGCIMALNAGAPEYRYCAHTQAQIGWWDDDADGVPDMFQGAPVTTLAGACASAAAITGEAYVSQHYLYPRAPAWNGIPHLAGLGSVAGVEYRINRLTWLPAAPADGAFDSGREDYDILHALPDGTYAVEVRAVDEFGRAPANGVRLESCTVSGSPVTTAAPFAVFTASPARTSAGHIVTLDASATNDLTAPRFQLAFRWDFDGNGQFDTGWSVEPRTQHAYATQGTFAVKLEVRNPAGVTAAAVRSISIAAGNLAPFARLRADRQLAVGSAAPRYVLSATASTDPEGEVLEARWDFDGDTVWDTGYAAALTAAQVFDLSAALSGVFAPVVEVRDPHGATAIASLNLRAIAYNHAPAADFTAAPTGANQFQFTASASDPDQATTWDGLLEYRWDFDGDGKFETPYTTATAALFTFVGPGAYRPTLVVRDRFRAETTRTKSLNLFGPAPTGLTADGSIRPLEPVLSWSPVAGAKGYQIELGRAGATEHVWRSVAASVTAPALTSGVTYWWRVSALTDWYEPLGFSASATYKAIVPYPTVRSLAVEPALPRVADTLEAVYVFEGVGRPEQGSRLAWLKNGAAVAELQGSRSVAGSYLVKGDRWSFAVTPGDGAVFGPTVTSDEVVVQNTPPLLSRAILNFDGTLTCSPEGWQDADGDTPGYRFQWYVDGEPTSEFAHAEVAPEPGSTYQCVITPFDGEDDGASVHSESFEAAGRGEPRAPAGCACGQIPGANSDDSWVLLALVVFARVRRRRPTAG